MVVSINGFERGNFCRRGGGCGDRWPLGLRLCPEEEKETTEMKGKKLISNHPETGKLQYAEKRFVLSGASSEPETDEAFSYDL